MNSTKSNFRFTEFSEVVPVFQISLIWAMRGPHLGEYDAPVEWERNPPEGAGGQLPVLLRSGDSVSRKMMLLLATVVAVVLSCGSHGARR